MTLVHESKRACIGAMVPLDKKLENFVTNLLPLLFNPQLMSFKETGLLKLLITERISIMKSF